MLSLESLMVQNRGSAKKSYFVFFFGFFLAFFHRQLICFQQFGVLLRHIIQLILLKGKPFLSVLLLAYATDMKGQWIGKRSPWLAHATFSTR